VLDVAVIVDAADAPVREIAPVKPPAGAKSCVDDAVEVAKLVDAVVGDCVVPGACADVVGVTDFVPPPPQALNANADRTQAARTS
jgi:hypothetical protein